MIPLQPHPEGLVLPVRAQPGARSDEVRGQQNHALKVAVTQVAEKGKANRAIVGLLCKALGLRKSQIELVAGATSTEKRFLIRQVTEQQLREKLAGILPPDAAQRPEPAAGEQR